VVQAVVVVTVAQAALELLVKDLLVATAELLVMLDKAAVAVVQAV
jgi:hypothetical protein